MVTAYLDAVSASNVTVYLGFSGTASNGTDYVATASSLVITNGTMNGTITLTGTNDELSEGPEQVSVTITSVVNATIGAQSNQTATIIDDDINPHNHWYQIRNCRSDIVFERAHTDAHRLIDGEIHDLLETCHLISEGGIDTHIDHGEET